MTTKKAMLTTGMSIVSAFVLFAAPSAHAATNQADIINSGDGFSFDHSASTRTNVQVNNTNVTDVMQDINARVETGGNSVSRNIGTGGNGTGIMTGNATVGVGLQVAGNHNDTMIGGLMGGNDANYADVVNTGDRARVNSSTNNTTNVNVNNDNRASVNQRGDIQAFTGRNDLSRNIGGGGWIDTGSADVAVGLNTNTNHNMTGIEMGGGMGMSALSGGNGTNYSSVVNTGDRFDGNARSNTRTNLSSNNYNRMNSYQSVSTNLKSGNNDSRRGIGGDSDITTGTSRFVVGSSVQGNHNMTMFGGLADMLWSMFQ